MLIKCDNKSSLLNKNNKLNNSPAKTQRKTIFEEILSSNVEKPKLIKTKQPPTNFIKNSNNIIKSNLNTSDSNATPTSILKNANSPALGDKKVSFVINSNNFKFRNVFTLVMKFNRNYFCEIHQFI